jgi:hypothetical protein
MIVDWYMPVSLGHVSNIIKVDTVTEDTGTNP